MTVFWHIFLLLIHIWDISKKFLTELWQIFESDTFLTEIWHNSDAFLTDFWNWQFSDRFLIDIWHIFETFATYIEQEFLYSFIKWQNWHSCNEYRCWWRGRWGWRGRAAAWGCPRWAPRRGRPRPGGGGRGRASTCGRRGPCRGGARRAGAFQIRCNTGWYWSIRLYTFLLT